MLTQDLFTANPMHVQLLKRHTEMREGKFRHVSFEIQKLQGQTPSELDSNIVLTLSFGKAKARIYESALALKNPGASYPFSYDTTDNEFVVYDLSHMPNSSLRAAQAENGILALGRKSREQGIPVSIRRVF